MTSYDSNEVPVQTPRRPDQETDRATLGAIARQATLERGLEPDFPAAALEELKAIAGPAAGTEGVRDVRERPWSSIDNDDSRDLDQLTVAESLESDHVRVKLLYTDVARGFIDFARA